jgi:hypothetical protein
MDTDRQLRRFQRTFWATVLVGLALLLTITVRVDPFGTYRHLHLSRGRFPTVTWSRVATAERLLDDCDLAFVGSSRVVFGYGTKLPRFGGFKACNGALGGTSIRELKDVFDFIVDDTDIQGIVFFVDLHMFHDGRAFNHDFPQSRFNTARTPISYYAWTATSFDALGLAVQLSKLDRRFPALTRLVEPPKPMRASSAETRGMIRTTMLRPAMYRRFEGPKESLALFDEMLDEAQAKGIKLVVVLPAAHAMQFEAEYVSGLWETNKTWRRFLVAETAERGIPLWDFATYHAAATSRLPLTPNDKPNPRWTDMSHQSQLLGEETLERVRDAMQGRQGGWDPQFGVRLTPENIEAHLAALDAGRLAWREKQPEQAAWFDAVVDEMRRDDPEATHDWEINRRRGLGEDVAWEGSGQSELGEDGHLDL